MALINPLLLYIVGIVMMLVLLAMIIDLGCGIAKAKQRGEMRTSTALRRTLQKFISYEGSLLIAAMVDILIGYSQIYAIFHFEILSSTPIVCLLVGIFLLVVEFLSVREKADAKTKRRQSEVLTTIADILTNEEMKSLAHKLKERARAEEGHREEPH